MNTSSSSLLSRILCYCWRQDKTNTEGDLDILQNPIYNLENESYNKGKLKLVNECAICLQHLDKGQIIYMKGCNCAFHFLCVENYVESLLSKGKNELYCPLCQSLQLQILNNFKYSLQTKNKSKWV